MKNNVAKYKKYPTLYQAFDLNGKVSPDEFYHNKDIIVADDYNAYQKRISNYSSKYSEYDCISKNGNLYLGFREKNPGESETDFIHLSGNSCGYFQGCIGDDCNRHNIYYCDAEKHFYDCGRPYYKVHDTVLPAMLHTTTEIKVKDFKMPYASYSILLPEGNLTGIDYFLIFAFTSRMIKNSDNSSDKSYNIMVSPEVDFGSIKLKTTAEIPLLLDDDVIRICFIGSRKNQTDIFYSSMLISPSELDMTLGQIIDKQESAARFDKNILKLMISVSLLATGSHKMVEPDIMEHLLDEYRKLTTTQKRKNKIISLSKEKGYTGFSIGAVDTEKRLPNGIKVTENSIYDAQSYISRCPHVRCGHYRHQAHGCRFQERKIIWIMPTFVYPNKNQ